MAKCIDYCDDIVHDDCEEFKLSRFDKDTLNDLIESECHKSKGFFFSRSFSESPSVIVLRKVLSIHQRNEEHLLDLNNRIQILEISNNNFENEYKQFLFDLEEDRKIIKSLETRLKEAEDRCHQLSEDLHLAKQKNDVDAEIIDRKIDVILNLENRIKVLDIDGKREKELYLEEIRKLNKSNDDQMKVKHERMTQLSTDNGNMQLQLTQERKSKESELNKLTAMIEALKKEKEDLQSKSQKPEPPAAHSGLNHFHGAIVTLYQGQPGDEYKTKYDNMNKELKEKDQMIEKLKSDNETLMKDKHDLKEELKSYETQFAIFQTARDLGNGNNN